MSLMTLLSVYLKSVSPLSHSQAEILISKVMALAKEALEPIQVTSGAFMNRMCSHKRDFWGRSHPLSNCEDLKENDGT